MKKTPRDPAVPRVPTAEVYHLSSEAKMYNIKGEFIYAVRALSLYVNGIYR